ncbi:MAG: cytochrome C oxidase subunit IV family protein [Deltaproteobacteria bacterium]|nr:cytochrome C oxidase subunit IV family protein [Deltaproteobacteria bacterium]MCX7952965.1 cytochrome C oxidase subunit IV family protein [Deltaproteobacteria bacterium]
MAEELGHIIHPRTFLKVLVILLVLTLLTVLLSPRVSGEMVDFGKINIVIALSIAIIKASLVLSYFMHLKFEGLWILVYFITPVILLLIMILGLFIDTPVRIDPIQPPF